MQDFQQMRTRLKIALGALLLVDIAAIAMLMTPVAGSADARQQELQATWLQLKTRESAPWRGLDKKIPLAQRQIADFYQDRFPAEDSSISADLGSVASETGATMSQEKYTHKDSDLDGLQRVEIDADVSGDYLQLVRFINALERNRLFFIVDSLNLGSDQNGIVKLQIKVETYLRTT
jgi:type IV pilus assembly protein PilO